MRLTLALELVLFRAMFNLGFDAKRIFHNFTGLGNYSRDLVLNLQKHFPEHTYHLFSPKIRQHPRLANLSDSNTFRSHHAGKIPGAIWRSFLMGKDVQKAKIDLYHGLSNELPSGLAKRKIKQVVTIHDLIFKHYPENYKAIDRVIYDRKFKAACQRADKIVAVSQFTKADIINSYSIQPEKIEVIYQACHPQFLHAVNEETKRIIRQKHQLPDLYFLYVGSIIPRKNLLGIVKAMAIMNEKIPLVVIGDGKNYLAQVKAFVHQYNLEDQFIHIAPDFKDFPAIYQQALGLVLPAFMEGFGIPVIEALFSKIPVITTPDSAMAEGAGPGALYVAPDEPEAIAEGMMKLVEDKDLEKQLVEKGHQHVQQFQWEDLSRQMMDLYLGIL